MLDSIDVWKEEVISMLAAGGTEDRNRLTVGGKLKHCRELARVKKKLHIGEAAKVLTYIPYIPEKMATDPALQSRRLNQNF